MTGTDPDGRRAAGERTRQRLISATLELLAERGEDAVKLRDITDAADANVASVSYHFGSKDALCRIATEDAMRQLATELIERLRGLPPGAPLEDIVAAWAAPVFAAGSGEVQTSFRVLSRIMADPPAELRAQVQEAVARPEAEILHLLGTALPEVTPEALRFRMSCLRGMFTRIVSGGMHQELEGKPVDEVEALLVPVIVAVLRGA